MRCVGQAVPAEKSGKARPTRSQPIVGQAACLPNAHPGHSPTHPPANSASHSNMPWLEAHLTIDKSRAPLIELLFERSRCPCGHARRCRRRTHARTRAGRDTPVAGDPDHRPVRRRHRCGCTAQRDQPGTGDRCESQPRPWSAWKTGTGNAPGWNGFSRCGLAGACGSAPAAGRLLRQMPSSSTSTPGSPSAPAPIRPRHFASAGWMAMICRARR